MMTPKLYFTGVGIPVLIFLVKPFKLMQKFDEKFPNLKTYTPIIFIFTESSMDGKCDIYSTAEQILS